MSEVKPEAGSCRAAFAQIVATTIKNFLLLDLGLALAFPTIVIPALTGIDEVHNPNEYLHMTPSQSSWLGSLAFICQPLGSCFSGWIGEALGRKTAMIVVNIPHIIAWALMYNASSIEMVFIATALFGLGIGLMEAPIITYIGEICQPSIRGMLVASSGISSMLGLFIVYFLGSVLEWRNVALICLVVPIISMFAICFIPETPLWLLSKNRPDDARKSLQWLRGWVPPKAVQAEFSALQRYSEHSRSCDDCIQANTKCTHPPANTCDKLREILKKPTMKAFILVNGLFVIVQFSGMTAMRPYSVQILKAYGVAIDANWATMVTGFLGLLANIVLVACVRFTGKRVITLISTVGSSLSCVTLAIFAHQYLPSGMNSFELASKTTTIATNNYLPLYAYMALTFFTSVGLYTVPWLLLSEIFPFKSRAFATGISAALTYVFWFLSTKTYYNLEMWLSLSGVAWFYGIFAAIGVIVIYFLLPETEGRTLEEIEMHFADNSKGLADNYIPKSSVENAVPASGRYNNAFVSDRSA